VCLPGTVAIHGILREADGCIWLVQANDREPRIVWPLGFTARFDPFVVLNSAGLAMARDGDLLLAGGFGPLPGEADACGRSEYVVLEEPVPRGVPGATIPP
jgi:hypothetical protein